LQHGGHEAIIGSRYQQAVEKLLKAVLIRRHANPFAVAEGYGDPGISSPLDMQEVRAMVSKLRA
jgi:hypothetical protein